jgi:magnesium transporter
VAVSVLPLTPLQVRYVDDAGAHPRRPDDVIRLVGRDGLFADPGNGFFWVDVPRWDAHAEAFLTGLGCHPLVLEACRRRNYVPTVHVYDGHVFVTTQSPLLGAAGHVHLLELDQVIGEDFLVTVHGPLNPEVEHAQALVETEQVLRRIRDGRFRPTSPAALSYAITSAVARRQRALVSQIAEKLPGLEKQVMTSQLRDPEELLEVMFLIRHELITGRTMAAQCHDVWTRLAGLRPTHLTEAGYAHDLADQFDRVRSLADGEAQFLFGVIELYQTKVHTKMTVAMERLAVIAAVTLPVTAIASVYGMNVIVSEHTHYTELALVLAVMLAISLLLLAWARRQGWW